ncbi:MAG: glycoside hydrolase family 19 protein [Verrucomicrobiota bacterium]
MVIQYLLNLNYETTGLTNELPVTGLLQWDAVAAIKTYQRKVGKMVVPDGRISPAGTTLKNMLKADTTNASALVALRKVMGVNYAGPYSRAGELSSSLGIIDPTTFINLYSSEFVRLGAKSMDGLTTLLTFINADQEIADVGWAAYMLATVKHECAETWLPIEEYGKGASHTYGNAVKVTDPATGATATNKYYGRGYVQLTWDSNYKTVGNAIGLGNDLWMNPNLALDASVAYAIMSHGMRNGSFTGKKLATYINRTACDYPMARKIINGLDQHTKIGGYAERLELILRASCDASTSSCF